MDGGDKPKSTNTTKYRRRSTYGTSRKSILKKSFNQEQVNFTAPLPDDPHVAIIGGGVSGLLCALSLEKHGIRSTVFDTVCSDCFALLHDLIAEKQYCKSSFCI